MVTHGIWEISKGKNDRVFIKCSNTQVILHPEEICKTDGLGMYGYEHLQNLAIAILLFEKAENERNGIMSKVKAAIQQS